MLRSIQLMLIGCMYVGLTNEDKIRKETTLFRYFVKWLVLTALLAPSPFASSKYLLKTISRVPSIFVPKFNGMGIV